MVSQTELILLPEVGLDSLNCLKADQILSPDHVQMEVGDQKYKWKGLAADDNLEVCMAHCCAHDKYLTAIEQLFFASQDDEPIIKLQKAESGSNAVESPAKLIVDANGAGVMDMAVVAFIILEKQRRFKAPPA